MSAVMEAPALTAAPAPAWTVLCVDDEPHVLAALRRVLRTAGYAVLTATDGEDAQRQLARGPVDVVISDMRMPGMDGATLLEQVQRQWPQTERLLLTGHADVGATVAAVNRGRIFRCLHKPWDEDELLGALADAVERLAMARERSHLEALTREQNQALRTLNSELEDRVQARTAELHGANERLQRHYLKCIKVFTNLLELRGGQAAGHCRRVAEQAREIARAMSLPTEQVQQVFIAGLLHDVGMIGLPDRLITRPVQRLDAQEQAQYRSHPVLAEQSLLALDDLAPLLPIVRAHHERHDGQGFPDHLAGAAIPLGARILAVADAHDDLQHGMLIDGRLSAAEARVVMREARGTQFDPEVLDVFLHISEPAEPQRPPDLRIGSAALAPDMVLSRDLVAPTGLLMLSAGHRLTPSLIRKIREFETRTGALEIHVHPITR